MGLLQWLSSKEAACNAGDASSMRVQSLGREDPLEVGMQPIPVFLPGEFHGQRSLVDYSLQGHKEQDMTGATERAHTIHTVYETWDLAPDKWQCLNTCFVVVVIIVVALCQHILKYIPLI